MLFFAGAFLLSTHLHIYQSRWSPDAVSLWVACTSMGSNGPYSVCVTLAGENYAEGAL